MKESLQEFVDSRGLSMQIDRANGLIRGVKILGLESRNGRTYLPSALNDAIPLYEGAKVNINHARGNALAPRDYQDRIGLLRRVRFESGAGLFADLHFNPKHMLAEQLAWDAEHAPENVGLSHNVEARTSRRDGRTTVEAIAAVHSVDLVADPATTSGLFEEAQPGKADCGVTSTATAISQLTLATLRQQRPDLLEAVRAEDQRTIERLREELETLRATESLQQRRLLIARLLSEHDLPDLDSAGAASGILGERFLETLLCAADESQVREKIAERAELVRQARQWKSHPARSGQPRSSDQRLTDGARRPLSVEEFVRAIT